MVVSYRCEGKILDGEGCLRKGTLIECFGTGKRIRVTKAKATKRRVTNHNRPKAKAKGARRKWRSCVVYT